MGNIVVKQVSYTHPDKETLFRDISFTVTGGEKVALIGNNGCGKSTLLKIMAGLLQPASGEIIRDEELYYIPQHAGQFEDLTVAEALGVSDKVAALHAILRGEVGECHFAILDDDWQVEERCRAALDVWGLREVELNTSMDLLSGGEKTRCLLAGMDIHVPSVILLDEPTNHLDDRGRQKLYDFVRHTNATVIAVSHDRTLLNLIPVTIELDRGGINLYGGNYDFYKVQKEAKIQALRDQVEEKQKALRLAKRVARETAERQQKRAVRGEKQGARGGGPRIIMGALKEKAEKSGSKMKDVHAEKINSISTSLSSARAALPGMDRMKMDFTPSVLHEGKLLIWARDMNFGYGEEMLWRHPLSFRVNSGERVGLRGGNGSGKTTLLRILLGQLLPSSGECFRADVKYVYLDQECTMLQPHLSVYEQLERFNGNNLPEHELKIRLNRFLFSPDSWNKSCRFLSGGERIRLVFCCLMISDNTPDLFVLDEPTNNLDIQNIEIMTSAIKAYRGTLLVVSHDRRFMEEIGVECYIEL